MTTSFTFTQLRDEQCMAAWEVIGRKLTPIFLRDGQVSEVIMDGMEPDNPLWRSESEAEQTKRAHKVDRDKRTFTEGRARHINTVQAQQAMSADFMRKKNFVLLQEETKRQKEADKVLQAEVKQTEKAAQEDKKKKKQDAEKAQKYLTLLVELARQKSLNSTEEVDGDWACAMCEVSWDACFRAFDALNCKENEAGEWVCDECTLGWDKCACLFATPDTKIQREFLFKNWRECGIQKCKTSWCSQCRQLPSATSIQHTHEARAHPRTATVQATTKKRKAATLAKAEEDLAKHRAPPQKRKPKPVQPPPSTDLLPLPITSNPYNKCVDLLKNDAFVERSKSLFANLKTDFTLNELTNIDVLEKSVRLRLSNHVRLHTGMTPAQKTSYVWDYARENLAQGLAWRVMQRLVDISDVAIKSGDDMQRYMHLPNTGLFAPMPTEGTALFGCYLTYDSTNDVWVRSGKAVNLKNRKAQHDTAMTNLLKSSLFYQTFRHRWEELSWFATTAWTQQQACTSTTVMHMSKATVAGLERAKWGGVTKNRLQRETELAAYLCELVDDLLLDPRYTGYSEGPGFESPMCYVKARK